jgi:hypothetical protein
MPHIVHTECTEPKRGLIRSDGALYVVLLLGVFLAICLSHFLADKLGVSKLYVQIGLYAVLLGTGYWIYRARLVDYLYELYDTELRVLEIVGKKQKLLLTVPIGTVTEIGPYRKTDAKTEQRTFHGPRERTTAVWFTMDGEQRVVCLNASDALKGKLSEAAHAKK